MEQALIEALASRYAQPQPEDRKPLDQAYADAMREVWRAYPNDADVGTLFAESLIDLHPWDLWTLDGQAAARARRRSSRRSSPCSPSTRSTPAPTT